MTTSTYGATRPSGRRDSRGPSRSALTTPARGARDRLPHYWFAHRLLLVLSGRRPVHSLLGHAHGPAYDQLARLAALAPLGPCPQIVQVGCSAPRVGALEVYARVRAGDRTRAFAFRLEQSADRRWRCAALELDITRAT